MKVSDLNKGEYLPYFQPYINKISDLVLFDGLEDGLEKTISFLRSIPADKLEYRYEEGKWTIKEVISHLIDSERIFAYRALRFARKDRTPVAGFEQDDYILECYANERSIDSLLDEFVLVKQSTIALYKTFGSNSEVLKRTGIAGGGEVSVRALGFLISGHEKHHCDIIRERYL